MVYKLYYIKVVTKNQITVPEKITAFLKLRSIQLSEDTLFKLDQRETNDIFTSNPPSPTLLLESCYKFLRFAPLHLKKRIERKGINI